MSSELKVPRLLTAYTLATMLDVPLWRIYELVANGKAPPSLRELDPTGAHERVFVRVRDIVSIEADGDGSTLRLAPNLTRKPSTKSLREWEQRLPDRHFVRIHRSTIVNLEYVERLEPWSHASHHVYLPGLPKPMTMSRRFGARLRERFG